MWALQSKRPCRLRQVVFVFLSLFLFGYYGTIACASEELPDRTIDWPGAGGGWRLWGANGESLFGISSDPAVLEVWQWVSSVMTRRSKVPVDQGTLSFAIFSQNTGIANVLDRRDGSTYLCVSDLTSGTVRQRVPQPHDFFIQLGRSGSRGKQLAVWGERESALHDVPRVVHFGLLASERYDAEWITTLNVDAGQSAQAMVHAVVVSDNGAYIAVAGWHNGVAAIDVARKRCLWIASWKNASSASAPGRENPEKAVPLDEVDTQDVAFSPDGKLIYAGGTTGCVYGITTDSGKVVSRWWASPTGRSEYGHRISCISVSPNGQFLAAGTGPSGLVFLFSTTDGKRRVIDHGGSTVLMTVFSPDSKHFASYAGGSIKIWKVHEQTPMQSSESPRQGNGKGAIGQR